LLKDYKEVVNGDIVPAKAVGNISKTEHGNVTFDYIILPVTPQARLETFPRRL